LSSISKFGLSIRDSRDTWKCAVYR
jgi:hypothetical protein